MLIDTHCHLGAEQFDGDRDEVVVRARAAGVGAVVVIGDREESSRDAIALAKRYGWVASAGVHPHEASSWTEDVEERIRGLLDDPGVVAVGEAGLDYHYDHSPRPIQREVFARQLAIGAETGLPVVVHSRSADADMAAMLRDADATIILHSFSAGPAVLEAGLSRDAYISFSGMVTFRSWTDDDAVRAVPANRLLIETDAPYLAPVPHRGRRNEPAFVKDVAARVAELRDTTIEEVATLTTQNAAQCFGAHLIQDQYA